MKISIVGYGHVGKAMHKLFTKAYVYDKYLKIGKLEEVNNSDVVFICVPTPELTSGKCDASIVEEAIENIKTKLFIIRSTVYIGFTDYASKKYSKNIVFQPEYYGETINHPFADLSNRAWLSFGGNQKNIDLAIECYKKVVNSDITILQSSAKEVEFAKYMENAYLASKVMFVNEMFDIAKSLNVNFNLSREIWLADPRIGRSHTFVYKNKRGYSGKCLPKDIANLKYQANKNNVSTDILDSIINKNKKYNN